ARLGGEDVGYGFRRDLKPISDVQAPFRGVRKFFYVAITEAAGISLFFTLPRLFFASQGGIVVFVALYIWDNKKEEEQLALITRNETLSRLYWLGTKRRSLWPCKRQKGFGLSYLTEVLYWLSFGVKKSQIEKRGFGGPKKAAASLPSVGVSVKIGTLACLQNGSIWIMIYV
ncbi:protein low PSII accumulation 1, chloroplastic, partial [Tanacetum coccineum]